MKGIKYVVAGLLLIVVVVAIALIKPTEDNRPAAHNSTGSVNGASTGPDESGANIQVTSPKSGDAVGPVVTITGYARVFENQFNYRIKDADGKVIVEGTSMSDAKDSGVFGAFTITAEINTLSDHGTVEVFDYSAKDGSETDLVSVPVNFLAAPSGS